MDRESELIERFINAYTSKDEAELALLYELAKRNIGKQALINGAKERVNQLINEMISNVLREIDMTQYDYIEKDYAIIDIYIKLFGIRIPFVKVKKVSIGKPIIDRLAVRTFSNTIIGIVSTKVINFTSLQSTINEHVDQAFLNIDADEQYR